MDKKTKASSTVTAEGAGKAAKGAVEDGTIRPAVCAVYLRILRCLPPRKFHSELPRLISRLISSLKSRDSTQRDAARKALCDVISALGPSYLSWIVSEMAGDLTRGFLQSVLVYTVFGLLSALTNQGKIEKKKSKKKVDGDEAETKKEEDLIKTSLKKFQASPMSPGAMDAAIPHLLPLVVGEIERQLDADRPEINFQEVGPAKKGVKEAKSTKGPAMLRLIAQYASAGQCMSGLLTFLYGLLIGTAYDRDAGGARQVSKAYSPKYLRRVRELLNQAVLGFAANMGLNAEAQLRLSLRLTSLAAHLISKSTIAARHRAARRIRAEKAGIKHHTGSYWVTNKNDLKASSKKEEYLTTTLEGLELQELSFLEDIDKDTQATVTSGTHTVVTNAASGSGGISGVSTFAGQTNTEESSDMVIESAPSPLQGDEARLLPIHLGGDSSSAPRARTVHVFVNADKNQKAQEREKVAHLKKYGGKEHQKEKFDNVRQGKNEDDEAETVQDEYHTAMVRDRDSAMMIQPGAARGISYDKAVGQKGNFDPATRATAMGVGGLKLLLVCLRRHRDVIAQACGLTSGSSHTNIAATQRKLIAEQETVDFDLVSLACKTILESVVVPLVICFESPEPEMMSNAARCLLQFIPLNIESIDSHSRRISMTVLKVFQTASSTVAVGHQSLSRGGNKDVDAVPTCTRLLAALLGRHAQEADGSTTSWFTNFLVDGDIDAVEDPIGEGEDDALARWKKKKADAAKSQLPDKVQQAKFAALAFTQAIVAQIRTALDDYKLAPSAIALFKRVVLAQQKRGVLDEDADVRASVYECADRLGELVVQSHTANLADAAGRAYIQFILQFPMDKKVQSLRVSHLLKNLGYGSEIGRNAVMNGLHRFVLGCPKDILLNDYAPLVILSIGARLGVETEPLARKLASVLLNETLRVASHGTADKNSAGVLDNLWKISSAWSISPKPVMRAAFFGMASSFFSNWGPQLFTSEVRTHSFFSSAIEALKKSMTREYQIKGDYPESDPMSIEGLYVDLEGASRDEWKVGYSFILFMERVFSSMGFARLESILAAGSNASESLRQVRQAIITVWQFVISHGLGSLHPWIRTASFRFVSQVVTMAAESPKGSTFHLLKLATLKRGCPNAGFATGEISLATRNRPLAQVTINATRQVVFSSTEENPDVTTPLINVVVSLCRLSMMTPALQQSFSLVVDKEDEDVNIETDSDDSDDDEVDFAAGDEGNDVSVEGSDVEHSDSDDENIDKSSSDSDEDTGEMELEDDEEISSDDEDEHIPKSKKSKKQTVEEVEEESSSDESDNEAINMEMELLETRGNIEGILDAELLEETESADKVTLAKRVAEEAVAEQKLHAFDAKKPWSKDGKAVAEAFEAAQADLVNQSFVGTPAEVTEWVVRKLEFHARRLLNDVPANIVRLCSILDIFAALGSAVPVVILVRCEPLLSNLINVSYRCSTMKSPYDTPHDYTYDTLKTLNAGFQMALVRDKGRVILEALEARLQGHSAETAALYVKVLTAVRSSIVQRRAQRRVSEKQMAVKNPTMFAQRKRQKNARKVETRKIKKRATYRK